MVGEEARERLKRYSVQITGNMTQTFEACPTRFGYSNRLRKFCCQYFEYYFLFTLQKVTIMFAKNHKHEGNA